MKLKNWDLSESSSSTVEMKIDSLGCVCVCVFYKLDLSLNTIQVWSHQKTSSLLLNHYPPGATDSIKSNRQCDAGNTLTRRDAIHFSYHSSKKGPSIHFRTKSSYQVHRLVEKC